MDEMIHWSDVFGNLVTAQEIVDAAHEAGLSLANYLRQAYYEIGRESPRAGYDAEHAPDFEALAAQIEREVAPEDEED